MNKQGPVIYDTHAAVKRLQATGLPQNQAEAVVHEQVIILEQNLANKADIEKIQA